MLPWLQFRLSTLMLLLLVVPIAACIAYRVGVDAGFQQALRSHRSKMCVEIYSVADLVVKPNGQQDFTPVIGILSSINPESWDAVGGRGCVSEIPASCSLVINQDLATHEQIKRRLAQLRGQRQRSWKDRLMALVD
jgi:hypothetical protein